jgi:hypothetical protein
VDAVRSADSGGERDGARPSGERSVASVSWRR